MDERADFLRAVCVDPADDTVRLAYADWLNRHGQTAADSAQAEFIRAQIETGCPDGLFRRDAVYRHIDAWLAPLEVTFDYKPAWMENSGVSMFVGIGAHKVCTRFERGFLRAAHGSTAAFMELAPQLFATQPITEVVLSDIDLQPVGGPIEPALPCEHEGRSYDVWADRPDLPNQPGLQSVPAAIADLLHDQAVPDCGLMLSNLWIEFGFREHALESLSRACVTYGRNFVGLPELPDEHRNTHRRGYAYGSQRLSRRDLRAADR